MIEGKRIYIAGAGGMLGEGFNKVYRIANTLKCTDKDVNSDWLSFLDFRKADAYRRDVIDFKHETPAARNHRLVARRRQIDYREPAMT